MIAEPLTDDTIRFTFSTEVVLDARSKESGAYSVNVVGNSGSVPIRKVLVPNNSLTSSDVILVVDKLAYGTRYRVTATNLRARDGTTVTEESDFISRRTKTQSILRSIPQHYDTRAESILRAIFTAIGTVDEIIGGARSDFIDAASVNNLLTESGEFILSEDGDELLLED